jgi:hypothetical protein
MARTTTTRYNGTTPVRTTVDGNIARVTQRTDGTTSEFTRPGIMERVIQGQTDRLSRQQARQENQQAKAEDTLIYDGAGNYRTVGASGSYRPKGSVTSGGVSPGTIVPANGGLVGGMPAGDRGIDPLAFRSLEERVAEVGAASGPQIGTGNPNEADPIPTARYPQDHYYDASTGNLWQWRATEGATAGEWIILCGALEQIDVAIDLPKNRAYRCVQSQRYPCTIVALHIPTVAYTISIAPTVGADVALGGTITLTLSGVPGGEDEPLSVSIETRRIG